MATSLLALLDDITAMTKVAGGKTAGLLGDDLALNAEQVSGVKPDRELPVVWAVAKGSAINKVILVPSALLLTWLAPWAMVPFLMLGGLFLCYEGFEKVWHKIVPHKKAEVKAKQSQHVATLADPTQDLVAAEKAKIKGAIRTDFILSAEIIVITLSTVATATFGVRMGVLVAISAIMTVGVYGLVAGIVKIDDLGLHLARKSGATAALGRGILWAAPWFMTLLSIAGTAAMFLVGGDILAHGIPPVEHLLATWANALPVGTGIAKAVLHGLLGVIAGGITVLVLTLVGKLRKSKMAVPAAA